MPRSAATELDRSARGVGGGDDDYDDDNTEQDHLFATPSHAAYCFSTLLHHYDGGEAPRPQFRHDGHHCPLFVTWDTVCRSSGRKSLRGCIGSLSPQPLASGLRSYALTSALRDRRFAPVSRAEVPSLHCTVSLLRGFESEGLTWRDWVPGKHGIIVEFEEPESKAASDAAAAAEEKEKEEQGGKKKSEASPSRSLRSRLRGGSGGGENNTSPPPSSSSAGGNDNRRRAAGSVLSATYLPHVASEQGWGVEEAIDSLVRKAGFSGEITDALRRELRLTRYESSMAGMGWREFDKEARRKEEEEEGKKTRAKAKK